MAAAADRLPGVYFAAQARQAPTALPRMDIAGFVGFARSGPLDLPVAIEDIAQFRDIFGEDVDLAWNAERSRPRHSYLGTAVELFFRNGGRRCWVVRVAGQSGDGAARVRQFAVSGMLDADSLDEVLLDARSPGSWADDVAVSAELSRITTEVADVALTASPGIARLELRAPPVQPEPGELLLITTADGLRVFLFVARLNREGSTVIVESDELYGFEEEFVSPSDDQNAATTLVALSETETRTRWELEVAGASPSLRRALILRVDLVAWQAAGQTHRMPGLGLHPNHPRYWRRLPKDGPYYDALLSLHGDPGGEALPLLWVEASAPRFPFAGNEDEGASLPLVSIEASPVSPPSVDRYRLLPTVSTAAEARAPEGTADIAGDGLDVFSADLFLDPDLAAPTSTTLVAEANHKRLVRDETLLGLHSLLPLSEVSIIAVPDAVHRHWDRNGRPGPSEMRAPLLTTISPRDGQGRRTLEWLAGDASVVREYRVQWSSSPDFELPQTETVERPGRLALQESDGLDDDAPTTLMLRLEETGCSQVIYFRVRAVGYGRVSPWSNTLPLRLPEDAFLGCDSPDVYALMLHATSAALGGSPELFHVGWSAVARLPTPNGEGVEIDESVVSPFPPLDDGVTGYEIQTAATAEFGDITAEIVSDPDADFKELDLLAGERRYVRVRALTAQGAGSWSNTRLLLSGVLGSNTLVSQRDYSDEDLLAVQSAAARFCFARRDTIVVAAVPDHYRETDVLRHLEALNPREPGSASGEISYGSGELQVPRLRFNESGALGHASLFHPWVRRAAPRTYRPNADDRAAPIAPPDGPVSGMIAARASALGAWLSPANVPLLDVLGLEPSFIDAVIGRLALRGANSLRPGPRGFVITQADTLRQITGGRFEPLSVRRFMNLLHRLIRREGNRYVFESNDSELQQAVRAQWEGLLGDLYARGALRGARPQDAFQVVIDPRLNDQRSRDQGRLFVELRVAPSEPLRFIHVRLILGGTDQVVIREL